MLNILGGFDGSVLRVLYGHVAARPLGTVLTPGLAAPDARGSNLPLDAAATPSRHVRAAPRRAGPGRGNRTYRNPVVILSWTTARDGAAISDVTAAALQRAIEGLVRGEWAELESTLVKHGEPALIGETKATLRMHYIRSDPNGRARLAALAEQLAQQVILFCMPRSRFVEAQNAPPHLQAQAWSQLHIEATRLFTTTQETTGEGAELLLYSLLEKGLGIPQVLSKMPLKTNNEMHIHGSDGVHAKILDNGNLALYWGEAKMYDDASSAIRDCFYSIAPFLLQEGGEATEDIFLMRHFADLGDRELTAQILEYFNNKSIKSAQVEARGACLIGFSIKEYPALPSDLDEVIITVNKAVARWSKAILGRLKETDLEKFEIEIFCMPVPDAQLFRDAVRRALGLIP